MTPGQRWRFRRNLVLWACVRRGGLSKRWVAEAFDLSRWRVDEILAEFDRLAESRAGGGGESGRDEVGRSCSGLTRLPGGCLRKSGRRVV